MNELGVTCTYECIFTGSILLWTKSHIVIVILQFYRDIKQEPVIQDDTRSFLTGSCNRVEIQVTIYLIVGSLIRETKYWYKFILNWSIVCILLYFPLENITLIWKCHLCQEGLQNLGVCSAPMSTDQWPGKVLYPATLVVTQDRNFCGLLW